MGVKLIFTELSACTVELTKVVSIPVAQRECKTVGKRATVGSLVSLRPFSHYCVLLRTSCTLPPCTLLPDQSLEAGISVSPWAMSPILALPLQNFKGTGGCLCGNCVADRYRF